MAIYFKMLSASGSLIAIPLDQLSGRLKKYDVKCEKNPDLFGLNKPGFFLSGIDGDLTVCLGAGQVCEQFVGDRIEDELEECRAFMLGVPHAPLK
jgi:hypothetical protein